LITEGLFPGSLVGLDGKNWQDNLQATIYYSMVTLTTLGYGDITPAAPITRFLAYMEALVGIFYTTVLVASLIGLRLSGYHRELPKNTDS
jgi:voltage-gated potassium channel Kch